MSDQQFADEFETTAKRGHSSAFTACAMGIKWEDFLRIAAAGYAEANALPISARSRARAEALGLVPDGTPTPAPLQLVNSERPDGRLDRHPALDIIRSFSRDDRRAA